jgi:hypothetical protein
VVPPDHALPDERKPRGVARALEQAGMRKKKGPAGTGEGAAEPEGESPEDEGEE